MELRIEHNRHKRDFLVEEPKCSPKKKNMIDDSRLGIGLININN